MPGAAPIRFSQECRLPPGAAGVLARPCAGIWSELRKSVNVPRPIRMSFVTWSPT